MGTSRYMVAAIFDFDAPLPRQLYWDASFLVHATYPAGRYHRECFEFLDRLSDAGNTLSYVSTLVLDEVVFTLIQLKVAEDPPSRSFGISIVRALRSSSRIWENCVYWWIVCSVTRAFRLWARNQDLCPWPWITWGATLFCPATLCT